MKTRIAIAGAGFAGVGLALALHRSGLAPTIFEKRTEAQVRDEGIFLTLAPNGLNALRALGLFDATLAGGVRTLALELRNETGKKLGTIDYGGHIERFGAPSITIRRGALSAILLDAARAAQIPVHFENAVTAISERQSGILVTTADGHMQEFDYLIGADGLRSAVRRLVMPDLPAPAYNRLLGGGGIVDVPDVPPTDGRMIMTFGRHASFGYIKQADGPVYWFNSFPAPESRAQFGSPDELSSFVRALHSTDPIDNQRIIAAAADRIDRFHPDFDIPSLPSWSKGRVALIGDAAHAVTPHSGQGGSMALEDALVLAACLKAEPSYAPAFQRFETLRRDRVESAVRLGRQGGTPKKALNWMTRALRDLILPIFIPIGQRSQERLFAFRVDKDPLAVPD